MLSGIRNLYQSVNQRVDRCVDAASETLISYRSDKKPVRVFPSAMSLPSETTRIASLSKQKILREYRKTEIKIMILWLAQTAFVALVFGNPWLAAKSSSLISFSFVLFSGPTFYQNAKKHLSACASELSVAQKTGARFFAIAFSVVLIAALILKFKKCSLPIWLFQAFLCSNVVMAGVLLLSGTMLFGNRKEAQTAEQEKQILDSLRKHVILLESCINKINQFVKKYPELKEKIIQAIGEHPDWFAKLPDDPPGYEELMENERLVLAIKKHKLEHILRELVGFGLIQRNNDILQCFKECMDKDPEFVASTKDEIALLSRYY